MESEIRVVPLEELEAIRAAVLLRKLSPGVGREFGKFSLFPFQFPILPLPTFPGRFGGLYRGLSWLPPADLLPDAPLLAKSS